MKTFNQWLKRNVVEETIDENVCGKVKTCHSCRNKWIVDRIDNSKYNCCKNAEEEHGLE